MIQLAQTDETPTITSVVTDTFPNIRTGARRDFLNIMQGQGYFQEKAWNKTDSTYTFPNGSIIEFFSLKENSEKARGGRRDRLFVNECNRISFASFEELEVRTRQSIYLDWNPTSEFWYNTEVNGKRDDVEFIILTFKDNEALDDETKKSILQRRSRRQWWLVYGEGQLGEINGRIYTDWKCIDEVPHEARLVRRGINFGYSVDDLGVVDVYEHNGGFILDEVVYGKGIGNRKLFEILDELPKALHIADSAEPKSIAELLSYGLMIKGANKGKGSVSQGVQYVQEQRISYTKKSLNIDREYRNYLWETDRDGKILPVPQRGFHFIMDAIRYALTNYRSKKKETPYEQPAYQGFSEFELNTSNEQINNNLDRFSPNYRQAYEQPEWDT